MWRYVIIWLEHQRPRSLILSYSKAPRKSGIDSLELEAHGEGSDMERGDDFGASNPLPLGSMCNGGEWCVGHCT